MNRLSVTAGIALCLLLILSSSALACPSCKTALASQQPGQGDVVSGFFYSILFMLSMPFTILGCMGAYMYWLVRKARAAQAAVVSSNS